MEHKEYKHVVEDSDKAFLFIHGIVGTPNHFDMFISMLPDTVTVHNLLLDGHGKGVGDFSRTSMNKWEKQVSDAVDDLLSSHSKIYIVAHSMGTLFSIEQAVNKENIAGLFLLAVPIKLFIKPKMIVNSIKVYFDKIKPDDKVANAAKKCYGIAQDKNPFHYLGWIPRYAELFVKIRRTRKILHQLNVPCNVYQSCEDEMVSAKSSKYLRSKSKMNVTDLEYSGHYYYDKRDLEFLLSEFAVFSG